MGMYDYLKCKYALPLEGANDLEFQTKDTHAQMLDNYEIREDGSLWHEEYDTEDRSDPTAEGLMRFAGCMTRVNQRWVRDRMTGEVRFYHVEEDGTWVEFSSYLINGEVVELVQIEPPVGDSDDEA